MISETPEICNFSGSIVLSNKEWINLNVDLAQKEKPGFPAASNTILVSQYSLTGYTEAIFKSKCV